MAPESLVNAFGNSHGRIEGSTSTFGAPFYGDRILGRLVYGESHGKQYCTEDDYSVPLPEEHKSKSLGQDTKVRLSHVILVERGGCSFVTKVQVARKKKAHAVIIVDSESSKATATQIRGQIVGDDGTGSQIDIPSILISRQEGRKLIDAAKLRQVIVELAWDVPSENVVVLDLWMSSGSQETSSFLKQFASKRTALEKYMKFVPHYHIFSMRSTKDFNELCSDVNAHYCAEDPDSTGPVTGRMVLEEDVRQLCIHETVAENKPSRYWSYVSNFLDECPLEGKEEQSSFSTACAERLMRKEGIEVDAVQQCIVQTREDKLRQQLQQTAWSPRAVRINGWRYSGALDAKTITRALCASFLEKPAPCKRLAEPSRGDEQDEDEDEDDDDDESAEGGVSIGTLLVSLAVVAVLALCVLYLYKRSLTRHVHTALREEVMLEVQSQMASYKPMES